MPIYDRGKNQKTPDSESRGWFSLCWTIRQSLAHPKPPPICLFNATEHAYLHTKANMVAMFEDAGFRIGERAFDRWAPGHDTITGFKA